MSNIWFRLTGRVLNHLDPGYDKLNNSIRAKGCDNTLMLVWVLVYLFTLQHEFNNMFNNIDLVEIDCNIMVYECMLCYYMDLVVML